MAQESNRVAAEEALLTALRRTSRRLYVRELTTDLLRATAVALIVPIALALWQLVREVPDALARTVMVVAAAGLAAYALWRVLQRRSLGEAAAVLDAQAQLRNELTTAEWFVRQRESDAWVDEQVARAGKRAEGLSVEGLVPFEVARPVWGRVAGLAALLIVLNLVPVTWTRELLRARPAGVLTSEELDKLADIRNLIDQAKNLTPEELSRLRALLEKLESNQLSPEEALAALKEAEEILAKKDDMIQGEGTKAEEAEGKDVDAKNDGAKDPDDVSSEEEKASKGEPTKGEKDELAEQAREELKQVEKSVSDRMEQQNQQGQQQQQQQQQQDAESEDSKESDQQGGEKSEKSSESKSEKEQESQSQMGKAQPDDSAKGDVAGAPKDAQGPLGEATKLDVKLKKEVLKAEMEPETLTKKELIDKDTQAGSSTVDFKDVAAKTKYSDAEPAGTHEIPWSYRELVKTYFQAVGPRGKHDRN